MMHYNDIDNRAAVEELVVDAVSAQIGLPRDRGLGRGRSQCCHSNLGDCPRSSGSHSLVPTRGTSAAASLGPAEALADALSRGLHGQELLSAFQAVMGFMSTAQAELAGPLNRRAGREGEAARMESPAAITGVSC
jgi:hypothetical protein